MRGLRDRCAIVGVGESDLLGKAPGVSALALQLQAIRSAVADAGLTKDDIDGIFTFPPEGDPTFMHSVWVAEALGLRPSYSSNLGLGGGTPGGLVMQAVMAIEAGLCNVAVCVFGDNPRTGGKVPRHGRLNRGYENWERPFGRVGAPIGYGMIAQRHMAMYGTTSAQLGAVAVAARKHGALNPRAQLREPISIADHQSSRLIVEPLRALDCCLVSDGGAAVVITCAERARDLRHPPAYIMGMGMGQHHRRLSNAATITETAAGESSAIALRMAGIALQDIDVAEIYDCFTITTLVQLEDLGFCPKGEGGAWVEGGRIELGGELPTNTDGGMLSYCYLEGMGQVIESVRQLRGECGPRQVSGAEIALATGNGGEMSIHTTLILRR